MSGFKKTGIYPLDPGCIQDRMLAPSKAIEQPAELENVLIPSPVAILDTTLSESVDSLKTHASPLSEKKKIFVQCHG